MSLKRARTHTHIHGYTRGWHSHQCTHIGACQRVVEEGGGDGRGEGGRESWEVWLVAGNTSCALLFVGRGALFFGRSCCIPFGFNSVTFMEKIKHWKAPERIKIFKLFSDVFFHSFPTYSLTLFHRADLISTLEHNSPRITIRPFYCGNIGTGCYICMFNVAYTVNKQYSVGVGSRNIWLCRLCHDRTLCRGRRGRAIGEKIKLHNSWHLKGIPSE